MPKSKNQIDGILIFFFSNDHAPLHFYARKAGEWEIKVYFNDTVMTYDIKWRTRTGPSKSEMYLIAEYVKTHRENLQIEWKKFVCKK